MPSIHYKLINSSSHISTNEQNSKKKQGMTTISCPSCGKISTTRSVYFSICCQQKYCLSCQGFNAHQNPCAAENAYDHKSGGIRLDHHSEQFSKNQSFFFHQHSNNTTTFSHPAVFHHRVQKVREWDVISSQSNYRLFCQQVSRSNYKDINIESRIKHRRNPKKERGMNIFANQGGNKENIENAGKRKDVKERSTEFQFVRTSKERRSQTKYKSKEFHENNNNNNNGPGCNYIDYSTIDEDAYIASKGPMTNMKRGVSSLFPQKLHNILDQGIHADIISWAPHGRCFIIHQPKQFVKVVLPELFQITKKTSFTRQLNLYGFVRLWDGHDEGGYYHEKFLRGKSKLCKLIKRKPLKGCKRNFCPIDNLQYEPKFYSMPYLPKINHSTSTSLSASTASSSSGNDTSAS
ncbi:hypothetical protein CTEN210_11753 [Chaetoceros tenuissimus]|uniref:HSF-type DNA-binding domain-containing protein n=1 Tax=Chaetoceros tenuissimus TaxID=426638 RepID=A0AAD3H973_9STRA|nr:hypothetical protein CTEN210_11753 [Chaetoceros tenuissimus]